MVVSTHSSELLEDRGIAAEEVLLLQPDPNGTQVSLASDSKEIEALLEAGESVSEAAIPMTAPKKAHQLSMFGD